LIKEKADVCLAGNHDLAVRGTLDLEEFGGEAAVAARWTREVLTPEAQALLDTLEPAGAAHGVELYHGSARDPIWEYVLDDEGARATLEIAKSSLVLVGHSHVALRIVESGGRLDGGVAPAGIELELDGTRSLLNPGSVGQPRDGDPRAAFLLLDLDANCASFRRAEYDVERTQSEMREAELPEMLAARLTLGL